LVNYYEILGLENFAPSHKIKQSFRKKAKKLHPDTNSDKTDSGMRLLLTAYQVLSNPGKRQEYDRKLRKLSSLDTFNYRNFLKERNFDLTSQSKLLFYDLLNKYEQEALDVYESVFQKQEKFLEGFMDREDYMECLFLLAEEYEKRNEFERSFRLLSMVVKQEWEKPYFKHFMEEIYDRMKMLLCVKLPGKIDKQRIIRYLEETARIGISKKYNAQLYKKIAEIYAESGEIKKARYYLERCLKNNPKQRGISRLMERVNVPVAG